MSSVRKVLHKKKNGREYANFQFHKIKRIVIHFIKESVINNKF